MNRLIHIVFFFSLLYLLVELPGVQLDTFNCYDPKEFDVISIGPPNYQLYEYMKKYSKEYDIPFEFALRCAREETGYLGKLHFKYKPFIDTYRVSYADAYGPLQVQIPTANDMWMDRSITGDDLGYNIEINVISSFRYKQYLYGIYGDWLTVYSIYNMGWKGKNNPNNYAKSIVQGPSDYKI